MGGGVFQIRSMHAEWSIIDPQQMDGGAVQTEIVMNQVPAMRPAQQVALARAGLGTDHREPSWELMASAVEGG